MQSVVIGANLLYISPRCEWQLFPCMADSKVGHWGIICGFNLHLMGKCSCPDLPCSCFSSRLQQMQERGNKIPHPHCKRWSCSLCSAGVRRGLSNISPAFSDNKLHFILAVAKIRNPELQNWVLSNPETMATVLLSSSSCHSLIKIRVSVAEHKSLKSTLKKKKKTSRQYCETTLIHGLSTQFRRLCNVYLSGRYRGTGGLNRICNYR